MTLSIPCSYSNRSLNRARRKEPQTTLRTTTHQRCRLIKCQSEPSLQKPKNSTPPMQQPTPPESPSAEVQETEMHLAETLVESETGPTIEFQRRQAIAMTKYFESIKFKETTQQPVFGWTPRNEIGNGRWVMFGLLVGLLTEYATGVNIVDQIKLIISNLGIADIYD